MKKEKAIEIELELSGDLDIRESLMKWANVNEIEDIPDSLYVSIIKEIRRRKIEKIDRTIPHDGDKMVGDPYRPRRDIERQQFYVVPCSDPDCLMKDEEHETHNGYFKRLKANQWESGND